jgi:ligand-binding sensor domain-containing protein|uniref:Regulator n=1 Tax=Rhodothermus marinus TaxID=29549 RepID=A0A7V2F5J4_RHOMR
MRWLLLLMGWCGVGWAQAQFGARWQAHTSMQQITDLALSPDVVWAATAGGVFGYRIEGGSLVRFTAVEGLHQVGPQALAWDARRQVLWIGYADGVLDRLDPRSGQVRAYFEIARATRFPNRQIYRLRLQGDTLFVATAFGLVVWDPVSGLVRDTYTQFGAFSEVAVYDLTIGPDPQGVMRLWLATAQGIAHAPLQAPNLKDPAAWTLEGGELASRLPAQAIVWAGDQLYVGLSRGLGVRDATGAYRVLLSEGAVQDLLWLEDRLLAAAANGLWMVYANDRVQQLRGESIAQPVRLERSATTLWIGDARSGLLRAQLPQPDETVVTVEATLRPEGPPVNVFADLAVDPLGNLWATDAATDGTGGFHRMDVDGRWTAFWPAQIGRHSFRPVHADASGNVWLGSDGGGLVQVTPEGTLQLYDAANSTLQPAAGTSNFIIVRGLGTDAEGRLWVANLTAPSPLHVRLRDGYWLRAPTPACINALSTTLGRLLVDSYGNLWIIAVSRGNLRLNTGLILYDPGDNLEDAGDDACRYLSERGAAGQGLPGVAVQALAEDRDGRIWIGTTEGLAYVLNHPLAASDPNTVPIWPLNAERRPGDNPFLLSGLAVNDLAVDPANRLWVATNEGVYVVEQAGIDFRVAAHYHTENSPLFSNRVQAIAIDPKSGRVFLATAAGLLSYQGDARLPAEQPRPLFVYPNPVRVGPDEDAEVFIEGLVEATELRILTLDGRLVARFATRGGRVRWNGRDLQGRPVPSGVYLVVAVGQSGEGTAYGKIAVLR